MLLLPRLCLLVLAVWFLGVPTSRAQELTVPDQAFAKGLKAQQEEDYKQAITAYEKALSGPKKSATAYNNLALAYFETGDLGHAILNFERALRHNRYHTDAWHNLKAARQHIDTDLKEVQPFWFFRLWNNIAYGLPSTAWAMILWFFLVGAAAGFILWYNSPVERVQKLGFKIGLGLAIASLVPFILGFQAVTHESNTKEVIVINPKAGIRTSTELSGEDIMVVNAGVKAAIQEEEDNWYRIRLANGVVGWIPDKMVKRIVKPAS